MRISLLATFSAIAFATLGNSYSSTIGFNTRAGGGNARIIATSAGDATSAFVRLGTFENFAANEATISGRNFAAIDDLFTPIGESSSPVGGGTDGPLSVGNDGNVIGSIQNVTTAAFPGGTQFYAWVVVAPSAAQFGEATEWSIFRDSAWVMPASDTANATFATFQINEPSEVVSGNLVNGQIQAQAVPEPSSAGLLALAGLGLIVRRRR